MLILWIIVIGWEADSRQEIILVRLPPISSFMRHFLSCIGVCFAFRTRSCRLKVHGPGRLPLIKATILSSLLCEGTAGGTCQEKMTQIMTWSWSPWCASLLQRFWNRWGKFGLRRVMLSSWKREGRFVWKQSKLTPHSWGCCDTNQGELVYGGCSAAGWVGETRAGSSRVLTFS